MKQGDNIPHLTARVGTLLLVVGATVLPWDVISKMMVIRNVIVLPAFVQP